jgi:type II secretory pathway pseudopilin PulG
MKFSRTAHSTKRQQRGAVFMVMLVFLILGVATYLVKSLSSSAIQTNRNEITAKALAQAKEALISYALTSDNAAGLHARPGNFPCPDRDAPGTTGYGIAEGSCSATGGTSIGRLPWKTLGIPELLDGDGEPLWYVLSDNFRTWPPAVGSTINSDTLGTLPVYANDGTTLLTTVGNGAVAIVFAPGNITVGQQRNTTTDKTTASNYLETANSINNSVAGGPFIAANRSDTFNDRLLIISTRDFIPLIEKRIASELKTILINYITAHPGVYPYPAPIATCQNSGSCSSDSGYCRGRLPYNSAAPFDWAGNYSLPATSGGSNWFVDNEWYRVIYYSAGTGRLAAAPGGCSTTLTVSGNNTIPALFFMPGPALPGVTRAYNNLASYLEDAENWNMDDTYVTPTTSSNDQLYVLP